MQLEFPYQIVIFLDKEPGLNEPVYGGKYSWYPQLALKRRFKLNHMSEEDFIRALKDFFATTNTLSILTGELRKPERMPVQVIHVNNQDEVKNLHNMLLDKFTDSIISRYPDREGENYYPHITAEYDGKFVIPIEEYVNKTFDTNNVWLLKDIDDENSRAFAKIR